MIPILLVPLTALSLSGCGVKGDPIPYLEVVKRADAERAKTEAAKPQPASEKAAP